MKCIICEKSEEPMFIGRIRDISVPLCKEHKLSCEGCKEIKCSDCAIKNSVKIERS